MTAQRSLRTSLPAWRALHNAFQEVVPIKRNTSPCQELRVQPLKLLCVRQVVRELAVGLGVQLGEQVDLRVIEVLGNARGRDGFTKTKSSNIRAPSFCPLGYPSLTSVSRRGCSQECPPAMFPLLAHESSVAITFFLNSIDLTSSQYYLPAASSLKTLHNIGAVSGPTLFASPYCAFVRP